MVVALRKHLRFQKFRLISLRSVVVLSALLVIAVQPDGPADLSGVLLGDALLALDGQALTQVDDLIEALTEERIGAELKFRILRAGEVREIPVRAGARS